jgi:hypothetical protein
MVCLFVRTWLRRQNISVVKSTSLASSRRGCISTPDGQGTCARPRRWYIFSGEAMVEPRWCDQSGTGERHARQIASFTDVRRTVNTLSLARFGRSFGFKMRMPSDISDTLEPRWIDRGSSVVKHLPTRFAGSTLQHRKLHAHATGMCDLSSF